MLLAYLYLALLEPKTPPKQLRRPCRELLPKRSRKEVERSAQRTLRGRSDDAQRTLRGAQRMFRGSSEARSGVNSKRTSN